MDDNVCVTKQHVQDTQLAGFPTGRVLSGHQHCKWASDAMVHFELRKGLGVVRSKRSQDLGELLV